MKDIFIWLFIAFCLISIFVVSPKMKVDSYSEYLRNTVVYIGKEVKEIINDINTP